MNTKTLGLVVGASLIPAVASAQSADTTTDPYGQTPSPTSPTTNTTVVTPAPAQQPPAPVVIVNPETETPRTTTVVQPASSYEVYDAWNAPVFATGALVFAGSYGAAAIAASVSENPAADRLYVPVVGPWLALNDWGDCPIDQPRCDSTTTDKVLLVADGVFQAAGLVTMVTGLLSPTSHTVYTSRTADTKKIKVTPTGRGVAILGRF